METVDGRQIDDLIGRLSKVQKHRAQIMHVISWERT